MTREAIPFIHQAIQSAPSERMIAAGAAFPRSRRLKTGAAAWRSAAAYGLLISAWVGGVGWMPSSAVAEDPPPANQPNAADPGAQPAAPASRGSKRNTRRDAAGRKPPVNRPTPTQPATPEGAAGAQAGDPSAADGSVPSGDTPEVDLQKRLQELQQQAAQQQAAQPQGGQPGQVPGQPGAVQPFNPLGQVQPNPSPTGDQPNPNEPTPSGQPVPGQPQPSVGNPAQPPVNPANPTTPGRSRRGPRTNTPATPPGAQPTEAAQIPALPADMGQPGVEQPSGPTTPLDIPATGGEAPETKTYRFSIKDGTYDALVTAFARQTGLGVVGDAPKDGKVNFVTTEELSFDEMLNRVRMLLFNYKPHEPYWLERQDKNLLVIRVNDFYRILPRNRMFPSVEAMLDANLKDEELALVIYTPKSGSVADLQQVRDFLPDYMRVTPLEDRNQLTLFALVKDIKKYLELIEFFGNGHFDPRKTERIPITNLLPSEALEKLRLLIELDAQGRPPRAAPVAGMQRGRGDSSSPIIVMQEPAVVTIPEDLQGYILVRAMPDKIEEIKAVLPYIDVELPHADPIMAIVRVHNAEPAEMIATVQQILGTAGTPAMPAAAGGAPTPAPGPRRGKKAAAANLGAAGPDQATMIPHPTEAAIIVLAASKDDVTRVQELVAKLDVPSRVRPIYIAIEHADSQDTAQSISQILGGGAAKPGKPPSPDRFSLVADPRGTGVWYTGSEKDLEQVRELLKLLDAPSDPATLHTYRLSKRRPSFVANMLREFEGSTPQPRSVAAPQAQPATPGKGRKEEGGGPGPQVLARAPVVASKFTSDDDEMRLFVICTETEWKHYIPIIEELEREVNTLGFRKIALSHVDPETAITRLGDMLGPLQSPAGTVRLVPSAGTILVINATEAQYDQMMTFMVEVDRVANVEERTFEIVHRDPAEIKAGLEALLLGSTSGAQPNAAKGKGRRGAGAAPVPTPPAGQPGQPNPVPVPGATPSEPPTVTEELTIVHVASKLVVRTSPEMMKKVAAIIAEFDVDDAKMDIRTYQFPPGTDVAFIADSLRSVVGDGAAHRPGKQTGAVSDAPKIIPQPASGKLIVIADPDLYDDIDLLVKLLQADVEADPVEVTVIPVHHADPADLVDTIEPVLAMKVRDLVRSGDVVELTETPAVPGVPADKQAQGGAQRKRGQRPGSTGERYHLLPSVRLGGIVVAAPRKIAEVARDLIQQFDRVGKEEEQAVVETVDVINTDAPTMVRAIREMLTGVSQPRGARGVRAAGKPEAGGAPATPQPITEAVPVTGLTIVEAPSGGAVILRGLRTDVDQAKAWIKQLDAMTVRGRSIRVFQIQTADIKKLVDLVLNVVDTMDTKGPGVAGGAQVPPAARHPQGGKKGLLGADEEPEDDAFVTSKTWTGHDIYIQADFLSNILLVASTAPKLTQIEQIIAQFDSEDVESPVSPKQTSVPHRMFELKFADASDVAWDAETLFAKLWQPKDQAPKVDSAGIGNSLIVSSMDDSRWDDIEAFIRENIDKPDPKKTDPKTKSYTPPKGLTAEQTAIQLKIKHPELDIQLKDISETRKEYGLKRLKPAPQGAAAPCVLPRAFAILATSIGDAAIAQQEPEPDESEDDSDQEPIHEPPPVIQHAPVPAQPVHEERTSDQIIRDALAPAVQPGKGSEKGSSAAAVSPKEVSTSRDKEDGERSSKLLPGQSVKVNYDSQKNVFVVDAPQWVLDEIKDSMKDLADEVENFPEQADIRIYRVRHIDVFTAQDIIEELFNATKAQKGVMQQQQQQVQAQQRAQQQQGQRQQEQAKGTPEKPGQPGKGGQPGQPTPQQLAQQQQQQQMNMPQLPPAGVRVYPNPRDRTLIFRAESSQYPAIEELLATIDQPKPVDSELRIFKLKKLNALDVEDVLKELLGLSEKPAARAPARAGAPGQPGAGITSSGPGSSLPQSVLTPSITGEEMLNVDPDDIKLTANEEANTIVVMAPKAAIAYVEKMIERLEAEDIPERITKYYDLKHADADEVADYLQSHFEAASSGGGRRASRGGSSAKEDSPAPARSGRGGLNAPSFFPYARLNLLTVQATSEQIVKVDDIVARLDAESSQEEWKDVPLTNADAKLVAETLSQMFGEGGGGGGSGGRGKSSAGGGSTGGGASAFGGGSGAKFIGEEGGRVVLFRAPLSQHEPILAAIKKLDDEAAKATAIHVLTLKNAMPSKVAEAVEGAYGIRSGAGGGGGSGSKKPIAGQLTITAHDPTRKLFVRCDEKTFKEIESLVTTLDGQRSVGFEFRIYPLKYANARDVHTTLTALVTKYLQQLGQSGSKDVEPFSVEVNDQANALVVLGGPVVFGFMEENLAKIDNPTAGDQRVAQQITLTTADATAVAKSLTDIFITPMQQKQGATGSPPISISAVQGSQTILVSSTPAMFEKIEAMAKQLDSKDAAAFGPQIIYLKHAKAAQLLPAIQQTFASESGRGKTGQAPPSITANEAINALIVRSTPADVEAIRSLVATLDSENVALAPRFKVIQVSPGLNVTDLAEKVELTINEIGKSQAGAGRSGQPVPSIAITPDTRTGSLIVSGSSELFAEAEQLAKTMEEKGPRGETVLRVVPVSNVSLEEIQAIVDRVTSGPGGGEKKQRPSGGSRRSRPQPTPSSPGKP